MPRITSRPPSAAYAAGWDRIFGKVYRLPAELGPLAVTRVTGVKVARKNTVTYVLDWSVKDLYPRETS